MRECPPRALRARQPSLPSFSFALALNPDAVRSKSSTTLNPLWSVLGVVQDLRYGHYS